MHLTHLLTTLLLCLAPSTLSARTNKPSNAILLSAVKSLTLRDGALTTSRRLKPIPQLLCTGGNAAPHHKIDSMRCLNTGSSYSSEDIEWTCTASLPPEFKLGSTEVVCEGYESAEDEYVLKGSCGVEYRLILTEAGEEKYGRPRSGKFYKGEGDGEDRRGFRLLFWLVFIGVVCLLISKLFNLNNRMGAPQRLGNNNNPYGGGGGGGGGGDDGNDPPPPYTPRSPPKPRPYSTPRTYQSRPSQSSPQSSDSWRPGFWSGAAAGGAAAYAANNFANRNRSRQPSPPRAGPSNWFGGGTRQRETSPARGGGGWFGGGGGSSTGARSGGWGSAAPAPAASGSRYESSGFGNTRRR